MTTAPANALTPDQAALMASYSDALIPCLTEARVIIDAAHKDGLAIPPRVGEALHALSALPIAWGANALGRPAPPEVKQALGLAPTPFANHQHHTREDNRNARD